MHQALVEQIPEVPGLGGWPLLTDFGSAQSFSTMSPRQTPLSPEEQIQTKGWTREYAAPEVVSCGGQWQSIRSDMYSWAQTIHAVSHDRRLPSGLHELCEACLSKDPKDRPSSFSEMADTLKAMCPASLPWGHALWEQQQAYFESSAHARKHAAVVGKQGLEVLLAQRQRFSADRRAESDSLCLLGLQFFRIGDPTEAVVLHQVAVKVNPESAIDPHVLANLGKLSGCLGKISKQRDLSERAARIWKFVDMYGQKGSPQAAKSMLILGTAYGDLGDYAKSKDLVERAVAILEACHGREHHDVADALATLAWVHGVLGQFAEEKDLLEEAVKIEEGHYGEDHHEVATTLTDLGAAYGELGEHATGKHLCERALRIKEAYYGKDHPEVAQTLTKLGASHGGLGDYGAMRDMLERALQIFEARYENIEERDEVAMALTSLGKAYFHLRDRHKTRDLWERALKISEAHYGNNMDHPKVAGSLHNLGLIYGHLGDHAKARHLLERALKGFQGPSLAKDHAAVTDTLVNLGDSYGALGDWAKPRDVLERALKIQEAYYSKDQLEVARTLVRVGVSYEHFEEFGQTERLIGTVSEDLRGQLWQQGLLRP